MGVLSSLGCHPSSLPPARSGEPIPTAPAARSAPLAPASQPPVTAAPAPAPTPLLPVEQDPCVFDEVGLASLPVECRCPDPAFASLEAAARSLDRAPDPRRAACRSEAFDPQAVAVTATAAPARRGQAAAIEIVLSNPSPSPIVLHLSTLEPLPRLVSAVDAHGEGVGRPTTACAGPGGAISTLSDASPPRAIVLRPGGRVLWGSIWMPRRAIHLRDRPKPSSSPHRSAEDQALVLADVFDRVDRPCAVVNEGPRLPAGRYRLTYGVPLLEREPVTVDVVVR